MEVTTRSSAAKATAPSATRAASPAPTLSAAASAAASRCATRAEKSAAFAITTAVATQFAVVARASWVSPATVAPRMTSAVPTSARASPETRLATSHSLTIGRGLFEPDAESRPEPTRAPAFFCPGFDKSFQDSDMSFKSGKNPPWVVYTSSPPSARPGLCKRVRILAAVHIQ